MTTLLRYPGGKSKLVEPILKLIHKDLSTSTRYIEPFLGGGSVALEVIKRYPNIKEVVLSDLDEGLSSLWNAVYQEPEALIEKIKNYRPSTSSFYKIKEELTYNYPTTDYIELGFKKLVIHQLSYSGLGVMSGGPLGGKKQRSKYKVDSRWSPNHLIKKIKSIHSLFQEVNFVANSSVAVLGDNVSTVLDKYTTEDCFIYLDPPYYDKGEQLYQKAFSEQDHVFLRWDLDEVSGKYAISYDNVQNVKDLYGDHKINYLSVNYSINGSNTAKEILITKKT